MLPDYPPTFLRGIPNKGDQFFDSRAEVTGNIFRRYDGQEPKNGFYAISINWEDDNRAADFTLREPKEDGSYHYRGGVARVSLERIDAMRQEAPWIGTVEYNREPIVGINNYHGNLLLEEGRVQNKTSRRALLARLQFTITTVIPPIE
jgi:hypothetical protein